MKASEMAKFITLEGIEGCGKSLQARLLAEEFRRRGIPFILTREPGGTPFGEEVRQTLLRADGAPREPLSELLLYLADRYQDIQEVILPALGAGRHVLCDRYHDATRVYQGLTRGVGLETVDRLSDILEIRTPDLTLVFDLEVEVGLARARQRHSESNQQEWARFEQEEADFHQRVREGYLLLQRLEPERVRLVDANGTPDEVFARALRVVEGRCFVGRQGQTRTDTA